MEIKIPQMILFDYGQTLVAEQTFHGVRGTEAVLRHAVKNKYNLTAEQVQAKADAINAELGRFGSKCGHSFPVEVPNTMFTPYLYESQGIEIALTNAEMDTVFWDAAAPGVPTDGIEEFLDFLKKRGIRTGVISNISYAPSVVAERIHRLLPENDFEFILTSSQYMFRKPDQRIYELALEKAELEAGDVWFAGDQYECDIRGAQAAGLFPVWYIGAVDLPYREEEGVLTVTSWSALRGRMN